VDGKWKCLTDLSPDGGEDLLFDLHADPAEQNNVVSQNPEKAARMKDLLHMWLGSCRKSHSGADYQTTFEPVNEFPV
jgi:hypothetical protein